MNKTFRVIWNDSLRLFQAVNELTRTERRSSGSASPVLRASAVALAISAALSVGAPSPALAADADITQEGEIALPAGSVLDVSVSEATTALANFTGEGGIRFTTAGETLTLGTTSSYTGTTEVSAGSVVSFDADNAMGETSWLTVVNTGEVKLNGHRQTVGGLSGYGTINLGTRAQSSATALNVIYAAGTGAQTIDTDFRGYGTISISSATDDPLSVTFGARAFSYYGSFLGTLWLENVSTTFSGAARTTQTLNLVLGTNSTLSVSGGTRYLNRISFNGGKVEISLDGASTIALVGGITATSGNWISIDLSGELSASSMNFFSSAAALTQTLFTTTSGSFSELTTDDFSLSTFMNEGSEILASSGSVAARLHWAETSGLTIAEKSVTYSAAADSLELVGTGSDALALNASSETGGAGTVQIDISGPGDLAIAGGTVTLEGSRKFTYTGATLVNAGSLIVAADTALATSGLSVASGAAAELLADLAIEKLTIAEGGKVTADATTLTLRGTGSAISGDAALSQTGTLALAENAALTVSGAQTAFTGNLTLATGAVLTLTEGDAVASAPVSGASGSTVRVDSDESTALSGSFSGSSALLIAGDTALSLDESAAEAAFAGLVTVGFEGSGGSLTLTNATAGKLTGAIDTTGGSLVYSLASDQVISETISGTGALLLTGTGGTAAAVSFSDTAASAFSGTATATNTALTTSGTGNWFANATLALGNGSTWLVAGAATVGALVGAEGSTIRFDTANALAVTGALTLGDAVVDIAASLLPTGSDSTSTTAANVLDMDDGEAKLTLASAGSVSLTNATLLIGGVEAGSARTVTLSGYDGVTGIWNYTLGGDGGTSLYVTYALTELNVSAGHVLTLTPSEGGNSTLSVKVTGEGGIEINTTGSVELARTNTYSGATTVTNGTLILAADDALGSTSGLTAAAGTDVEVQGDQTVKGALAVSGSLTVNSGALLTFESGEVANLVTETELALASSGKLTITGDSSIHGINPGLTGGVTIASGRTGLNSSEGLGSGVITISEGAELSANVATAFEKDFSNTITGAGTFSLTGGSSSVTSDAASFSGTWSVAEGASLSLNAASAASFSMAGGGWLELTGTGESAAAVTVHESSFSGTAAFTNAALTGSNYTAPSSSLVLNSGSSYTADTTGLQLAALTVNEGASLTFVAADALSVTGALTISGAAVHVTSAAQTGFESAFASNVLDQGTTGVTLATAGSVSLDGASLSLEGVSSTSITRAISQTDGTSVTGTYDYALTTSLGESSSSLIVTYALKTIEVGEGVSLLLARTLETGNGTLSAAVTGAGGITVTGGAVTLASANSYRGATSVTGGSLILDADNALGGTSGLTTSAGTAVEVRGDQTVNGALAVSGSLTVNSGAMLTFSSGSVANLTTETELALASPGMLTITGDSSIHGVNPGLTGGVTIESGTTSINSAEGLGTGVITINGNAELSVNLRSAFETSFANTISGSGTFSLTSGSGSVTSDAASFSGTWNVGDGAALAIVSSAAEYAVSTSGTGTLAFTGTGSSATLVTLSGSAGTFDLTNATVEVNDAQSSVSGGLSLNDGSELDFSESGRLAVTGDIALTNASVEVESSSLSDISRNVLSGNVLDQDESESGVALATSESGSVSLSNVKLNIVGGTDSSVSAAIIQSDGSSVTGTYDYTLSVRDTASGSAVWVSFALKNIDVGEGVQLLLAPSAESDSDATLRTTVTGEGGITVTGGEVTLTSSNSYQSGTRVESGTLILAADNALGNTSGLTTAAGTAVEVRGDQTVNGDLAVSGSLSVASGAAFAFTGGRAAELSVFSGGSVSFSSAEITKLTTEAGSALKGTGLLRITGDSAVTGANEGLTGGVEIASGTTRIDDLGGLGSGELTINGVLQIDGAVSGNLANDLSGSGSVALAASGAAVTVGSNASGFTGTYELAEGTSIHHYLIESLSSAADDGIAVAAEDGIATAGETQTADAVSYVFSNTLTGAGDYTVHGGGANVTFESAGQFSGYSGLFTLLNSTVELSGTTLAAAEEIRNLTAGSGTTLRLTTATTLQNLTLDGATLDIGANSLTAASLTSTAGSVISVAALLSGSDSAAGTLTIEGAAAGSASLAVSLLDGSVGGALSNLTIATISDGTEFTLTLEEPLVINDCTYTLESVYDVDGNRIYYLAGTSGARDVKTPGTGARATLALLAAEAFDLSLRGKAGDRVRTDPVTGEEISSTLWVSQTGDWTRLDDTSGQLKSKARLLTTHVGGDVAVLPAGDGTLRLGLLTGYSSAEVDTDSRVTGGTADGDFRGWSIGAYAAWGLPGDTGPWAGAQVRWNTFENKVQGEGLAKEKYDADGWTVALEAGWNQPLATGGGWTWAIEPHARVLWSGIETDTQIDSYGQRFETTGDGNVRTTLGARTALRITGADETGEWMNVFAELNWVHNTKDFATTVTNEGDVSTATMSARNLGELRLGLEAQFTPAVSVWTDLSHREGSDSFRSTGFAIGARYRF